MFKVEIKGLDKLQRDLKDAERALQSLNGTIASLKFNPNDDASVQEAIRDMERTIDSKISPYERSALIESLAEGAKKRHRKAMLELASRRVTPISG